MGIAVAAVMTAVQSGMERGLDRGPQASSGVQELAARSRRAGVLVTLRRSPSLTLEELGRLLDVEPYGEALASITLGELRRHAGLSPPLRGGDDPYKRAIVLAFTRQREGAWLSSGFFTRLLGLRRWTAQRLLAELARAGQLERQGRTSGTRYRLSPPKAGASG